MKKYLTIIIISLNLNAFSQLEVTDAGSYGVQEQINTLNTELWTGQHAETLAKWVESIGVLNESLTTAQNTLQTANTLMQYAGDPAAAAQQLLSGEVGSVLQASRLGELGGTISQTAQSLQQIKMSAENLAQGLPEVKINGEELIRDSSLYMGNAAIRVNTANISNVVTKANQKIDDLKKEQASIAQTLSSATNDAEVQASKAKIDLIENAIDDLRDQKQDSVNQAVVEDIEKRNQDDIRAKAQGEADLKSLNELNKNFMKAHEGKKPLYQRNNNDN